MSELFDVGIYQPIFNLFVWLYDVVPDIGVVIFLITLLLKLALYPLTNKAIRAQKSMMDLQPKLAELKEKHKDNQQMLAQETLSLYKENKVNPFGSCLPLLLQIPILLALYWVLQNGLKAQDFSVLYSFIPHPGSINTVTLGKFDLAAPSIVLAVLAGVTQFWQAKMMIARKPPTAAGAGGKDEEMMAIMNKQMLYMLPIMSTVVSISLPGGVALYWVFSTLLTGAQQEYIFHQQKKNAPSNGVLEGDVLPSKK